MGVREAYAMTGDALAPSDRAGSGIDTAAGIRVSGESEQRGSPAWTRDPPLCTSPTIFARSP
jgi:hypothetical protein